MDSTILPPMCPVTDPEQPRPAVPPPAPDLGSTTGATDSGIFTLDTGPGLDVGRFADDRAGDAP